MRLLMVTLLLGYGVSVHYSVLTDNPQPALIALGVLLVVIIGGRWRRLVTAIIVATIVLSLKGDEGRMLLYIPPVFIYLVLAWFFGRSLVQGETPLVTRIALLVQGQLSQKAYRYTRAVTIAWTVFLLLLALCGVLLAVIDGEMVWSLFTNFLSYAALGIFFLIEYLVRRSVLRDEAPASFLTFIQRMSRLNMSQVWRGVGM